MLPAISESSKPFLRLCLVVTQCILSTTLAQIVVFTYGRDPSSIFKEAVDGLFQQFLKALNLGNDVPCLLMTKSTHLTIVDWCTIYWLQILEGSFMSLEGCSWPAVPTFPESSEPFEWLTMPSYNIIYSLDNGDWQTSCWIQIWKRSFKHIQRCSWRAIPAIFEHSKPWKWQNMSSDDKIYSFDNCCLAH